MARRVDVRYEGAVEQAKASGSRRGDRADVVDVRQRARVGAMQMFIYETNAKRSPMTNGYAFPQLVWRIPAEGLARSQMRPKGSAHHHRGSIVSQPSSRS